MIEPQVAETELERAALLIASFIIGWWPGLEDGLTWPGDADDPTTNEVFVASARIMVLLKAARPQEPRSQEKP